MQKFLKQKVKYLILNAKIFEIEGKISDISGLATNATLTAVENKIPDVSSLVKKTDYNAKINDIEKKKFLIVIMANILLLQS